MSTKNETSIPMQNEDDGIHETYSHATGSKDNEDYETPYENDQYEQPYKGHIYAEYEKPKNKTENKTKNKTENKKRKNLLREIILFALVIVLFIVGCCILAAVILLVKVLTNRGLVFVTFEYLLVLVIVLLIAGLAAGIGSYFTMNHEDSDSPKSSTESSKESSTKNCEFDKNDECLDAVCSEKCSQCKNYRLPGHHNETCVPPEDRECVLDGSCYAERRRGNSYYHDSFFV